MPDKIHVHDRVDPVMETRLFPKGGGAQGYETTGLAARCDLVIHSDHKAPQVYIERRNRHSVRTVFVSLRQAEAALWALVEDVLPGLDGPVVVVSGSEDCTFPVQTDKRFPDHNAALIERVFAWLESPLIRHWYAENLSGPSHSKLSPIPLGMVFKQEHEREGFQPKPGRPIGERPAAALCAHRVRTGGQWQRRREITQLAEGAWKDFTTTLIEESPLQEFERLMTEHSFVICAEGGGLDPSPKAWHALCCGAAPIIRRSTLEPAYQNLPVLFVDHWTEDALSSRKLEAARRIFSERFPNGLLNNHVMSVLSIDWWWSKISDATGAKENIPMALYSSDL